MGPQQLRPGRVAAAVPLLRALGFEIGVDWDGELLIEPPAALDCKAVIELLRGAQTEVVQAVRFEAEKERRSCIGGPCNGRPHAAYEWMPLIVRIGRANWAVYRVAKDGRAYYVGPATSRKKGRALWSHVGTNENPS